MSEISVLSNLYEKLVDTSNRINGSVITIKKKGLLGDDITRKKYPKISVSDQEFESATRALITFLNYILSLLNEENQTSDELPLMVAETYVHKLKEDAYFKEKISELVNDLTHEKKLNEQDIKVLDRVISLLDSERTLLFRKLRTARG